MSQDHKLFEERGAQILAMGPDGPLGFKRYWAEHEIPFIGMADVKSKMSDRYYQEVNLFKMGRMPAVFVIDRQGMIRYAHYGDSMKDIPENQEILDVIDQLEKENG
ncbi:MAG: redoxin domain-containing protein [Chloroflexi bacterium]|nr:redoxin domain-containing protein [Chloroflexota bacterium]